MSSYLFAGCPKGDVIIYLRQPAYLYSESPLAERVASGSPPEGGFDPFHSSYFAHCVVPSITATGEKGPVTV